MTTNAQSNLESAIYLLRVYAVSAFFHCVLLVFQRLLFEQERLQNANRQLEEEVGRLKVINCVQSPCHF